MISVKRIEALLLPSEFVLVSEVPVERSAIFARRASQPHLFERIRFHCAGKRGEAAVARAETSVIRGGNATKGLVETKLLVKLASVPERGWTILQSVEDAKTWERKFVAVAPEQANRLSQEKGNELLAATELSRTAAIEICRQLGDVNDLAEITGRLEHEASGVQLQLARRLAEWPGVLQIAEATTLYNIATTAIVIHAPKLSRLSVNIEADPLHARDLMWLIQLLVDRIAIETAWKYPGC